MMDTFLRSWRAVASLTLTLSVAFSTGCGGGGEPPEFATKLVPAAGKVTLDGKPLAGATVLFQPADRATAGETASGITDEQGNYELTTMSPTIAAEDAKGAVPGQYKVTVSRILMPDGSPVPEGTTDADAMAEGAAETLPPRYSDPGSTQLKADVTENEYSLDFDL